MSSGGHRRNTLLRLTHTEEVSAQVRRTPATSADVERELARDAQLCRDSGELLRELISTLDGVYDVFAAVGRLGAAAKAQLEQGSTLPEALLTDLTLELAARPGSPIRPAAGRRGPAARSSR